MMEEDNALLERQPSIWVALAKIPLHLLANLWAACRLLLPFPASRVRFFVDIDQFILLALATFGVAIGCDYITAGPKPEFWIFGLGGCSAAVLIVIASAYLAGRLGRRPDRIVGLAVAFLATGIVLRMAIAASLACAEALGWAAAPSPDDDTPALTAATAHWAVLAAVVLFGVAIAARIVRRVLDISLRRAIPLGLLVLCLSASLPYLLPPVLFWYTLPDPPDEPPRPDIEQVYSRQGPLLDRALFTVQPHRPGTTELYFLGFAGWARQDVFLKEGRYVRNLFDTKFGTAGRSMLLVNNPATTTALPLASVSNLSLALRGLAGKMDVENDVLFLFLTSHGSPGTFAIDFDPLGLDELPAEKLKQVLDESGIKWRVIVISACYSGSFIDALKTDRTLIMTAAREDRTSFGCGNENDFTYFGEAYFSQALQHTYSFTGAFDEARTAIGQREAREKLTPSEPQIWVGNEIRDKLRTIEHRLAGSTGP